jgi:hypothetical protein
MLGILGAGVAYAIAVERLTRRSPEPTPSPRIGERADMRAILDAQAMQAERRARPERSTDGTTLEDWLEAFAKRLAELWRIDRGETRRLGREWLEMCDMRFPDPGYDWSLRGAVEMAEDYARENGEEYGANS